MSPAVAEAGQWRQLVGGRRAARLRGRRLGHDGPGGHPAHSAQRCSCRCCIIKGGRLLIPSQRPQKHAFSLAYHDVMQPPHLKGVGSIQASSTGCRAGAAEDGRPPIGTAPIGVLLPAAGVAGREGVPGSALPMLELALLPSVQKGIPSLQVVVKQPLHCGCSIEEIPAFLLLPLSSQDCYRHQHKLASM